MNAINNPQGPTRIAAPVMDAVQSASARTGVDFDYLVDVARVETMSVDAFLERWLAQRPNLPTDLWIETIPYKETREYVARVLAFSVLYDWRINGDAVPLGSRIALASGKDRRDVVCPVRTASTQP